MAKDDELPKLVAPRGPEPEKAPEVKPEEGIETLKERGRKIAREAITPEPKAKNQPAAPTAGTPKIPEPARAYPPSRTFIHAGPKPYYESSGGKK